MQLERFLSCDVLVLGSGLAGISAAVAAAEAGKDVVLACRGRLFSGSSFYPGTWGLGLIGPEGASDEDDLAATIERVGCGMADPELVRAFVGGIEPAVSRLRARGVRLRRAGRGGQREYVPCFDHKHRDWNGIEFESVREVFSGLFERLGVRVLAGWEAVELVRDAGRVAGAVLVGPDGLRYAGARAVVLATGGYGGLFARHLCTEDVEGLGQALALGAGATLVNMEFMQVMPAYVNPAPRTVFNEKAFRFARLERSDGTPLLEGPDVAAILDERSTYGPFTSRLPSRELDLALCAELKAGERGVKVTYDEALVRRMPEFLKTYFDWLREAKGLTPADPVWIAPFAHAANGGVLIGPDGFSGVEGLFCAGEVTGGMHGADRLGGLSTANGLVFGERAGASAARACEGVTNVPGSWELEARGTGERLGASVLSGLRETMDAHALVVREEAGLASALRRVRELGQELACGSHETADARAVARERRLRGQLMCAEAALLAARLRRESRGSHYRADHPREDPGQVKRITVSLCGERGLEARFA